jgi:hypothetical protein
MIRHMDGDVAVLCSYRSSQDAACSDSFEVYFYICCIVVTSILTSILDRSCAYNNRSQQCPKSEDPNVSSVHASYCCPSPATVLLDRGLTTVLEKLPSSACRCRPFNNKNDISFSMCLGHCFGYVCMQWIEALVYICL